jgi:hypothetical protein
MNKNQIFLNRDARACKALHRKFELLIVSDNARILEKNLTGSINQTVFLGLNPG